MMNAASSLKLYNHFRSSASYRVRIALNLKGLPYEYISIHLLQGEQRAPDFAMLNPEKLVPVLQVESDLLTQSLAIIEYLEEVAPTPPLLPADPIARARVRAFALAIACDLHPLNNLRVLQYLTGQMGLASEVKDEWYRHWISEGLAPLEQMMATRSHPERFCFGNEPGLADVFLVPQLYNARRTQCDLEAYPALLQIEAHCLAHDAFKRAAPENQPPA
jgi:maleylacetoacetate isomerase